MVPGRISDTLSHAMQRRQHMSFSRLFVASFIVFMVILVVMVFALSSGSPALASRPGRTIGEPKLLPFARQTGHQANIPQWHGKSGFGFALVGTAPAGAGSSITAIDEETNTIYVGNGFNTNGPSSGGNTVSVIDGRRCQGTDVSRCKGPWPTLTVGNGPSNIAVDEATDTVYVTNGNDNTVSVVNSAICNAQVTSGCNQTPATVPVGTDPLGIFADQVNHTVYIANFVGNTVSLLNSSTCNGTRLSGCPTTPLPTVAISNGPGDVDVNQITHTAYVATLTGMAVFDANTCNASTSSGCGNLGTATVSCANSTNPGNCGPFSAKVDTANNTVYLPDADNRVSVFDGRTCNASDLAGCGKSPPKVAVGLAPFAAAVDQGVATVYVSNSVGTVSVIPASQ